MMDTVSTDLYPRFVSGEAYFALRAVSRRWRDVCDRTMRVYRAPVPGETSFTLRFLPGFRCLIEHGVCVTVVNYPWMFGDIESPEYSYLEDLVTGKAQRLMVSLPKIIPNLFTVNGKPPVELPVDAQHYVYSRHNRPYKTRLQQTGRDYRVTTYTIQHEGPANLTVVSDTRRVWTTFGYYHRTGNTAGLYDAAGTRICTTRSDRVSGAELSQLLKYSGLVLTGIQADHVYKLQVQSAAESSPAIIRVKHGESIICTHERWVRWRDVLFP